MSHPLPVEVRPLPAPGLEDDPDACFAHFDAVLADLRAAGIQEILADFTRGTKAMSGALVLAAVRYDLAKLRYITGPRDDRGMVVPGSERIVDFPLSMVTAKKVLDQARHLFCRGNFPAAVEVLPASRQGGWPEELFGLAQKDPFAGGVLRRLGPVRLPCWRADFTPRAIATACRMGRTRGHPRNVRMGGAFGRFLSDSECRSAQYLRRLVADLWANGLRRVAQRYYEDAILRAYRVLELVGQCRLFDHGLDSAALPPEHPAVQQLQEKLLKGKSVGLTANREGNLLASREQVARLLKILGDPLGQELLNLGSSGLVKPTRP